MSLAIGVLGPLDIRHDGDIRTVPKGRLATFLTAMALGPNRVVPLPLLVEELGEHRRPGRRRTTCAPTPHRPGGFSAIPSRLVALGGGYVLVTRPGEVDADVFEAIVTGVDGTDPQEAGVRLEKALSLWRGPVLAGVPAGPLITARAGVLEELRLAAAEDHRRGAPSR